MAKACVFGAPVGGMGRFRPPAAPARLLLVFPLVLLVFVQSLRFASSLDTGDAALDRFRKEKDIDTDKSISGWYMEKQGGDLHSSAGVGLWNGRRQNIRRLLKNSGPNGNQDAGPSGNSLPDGNATAPSPGAGRPSPAAEAPPPALIPSIAPKPSTPISPPSSSPSKPRKWYPYLIAGVVVVVAFSLILVLFLHRNKVIAVRPLKTGISGQLTKALVTGAQPLKRADVETACESLSNIIGTLSDATLYKGTLSSGVEIAVSVIKANKHWHPQNKTQFKNKIALLSKVNHKNFVNLIGYCEESDPFSRMLIFEYAPNGTLFEHLHVRESQDLSWASRLRIAMGVAYCLEHMHHQLNPPIILKNLDSNVIYLTDDFAAKIADMELWSKTAEGSTGNRSSEALQHEMPDKESIVHKFGIVLLELLSGRPPYSDENFGLVSWASNYLKGGKPLKDMIDPVLNKVSEEDVRPFFGVIKDCLNPNPTERPTMSEVAARLKVITGISPEGAAPKLSPLWWAELEIITTEAT